MSRSLSNKHHSLRLGLRQYGDVYRHAIGKHRWLALVVFPLWTLVAFYGAALLVAGSLQFLSLLGVQPLTLIPTVAVRQTVAAMLIYGVAFFVALGVPYLLFKRSTTLKSLGLQRLMSWTDIGLAILVGAAYILVLAGVLTLLKSTIPGFDANQAQDIGFRGLTDRTSYIVAFLTLVVVAPIAEETLFRGYLYGRLRGHAPIWLAAIVTSVLFGAIHGQWNVAVDTFILSMFLCGLRELTGSIWSGILLHMLKNGLAFYVMFIGPLLGPMGT